MAELLSALIQLIFEKSTSQIFEEYAIFYGTRKEMKKLRSVLSTIQAVLEDAEDRQVTDKAVKNWLIKLKDVAYDVDDLLDEYMTEALMRKSKSHDHIELMGCIMNEVHSFCSHSNPVLFRYSMKNKLKKVVEKLNGIADERFKYHLRAMSTDSASQSFGRLQSDSYLIESEVLGRDLDKEKIVDFLIDSTDIADISVLPIVGMGGLGKTTLAKLVYNDEKVKEHFERRIWVCVSENFDVKRLMAAIVESVTGNRCDLQEVETIHRRIQELIMGQRFLLVLDDTWNEDNERWDRLRNSLRHGSEGSTILVTTRSEKVALIMGTVSSYCLGGLSDDDCWSLFEQRAFKHGIPAETSNIVTIGKEIVKKCRGVPLAAKALGSMMCLKRKRSEWLSVKDSDIWNIIEEENGILPVLRLSYNNLPLCLKQCFAYCSLFPKDWRINKEKLIQLWMAEGFIQSSQGKPLEEIGNEYFTELFWRSFFHNATKDSNGSIVACEMHPLVHDLAKSVAGTSCLTVELGRKVCVPAGTRHLSVVCTENKFLRCSSNSCNLRSFLLLYGQRNIIKVSRSFILSVKSLRSLDLSSTRIKKLSKSIGAMKHLRYVELSNTPIRKLPNSFCDLFNLQSLILTYCCHLETLPMDMRKLINLRHLNLYGCESLTELPNGMGELNMLQTLPLFVIGKETACSIAELENLDLQGELKIKNLENLMNAKSAKRANLKGKRDLVSLKLLWGNIDEVNVRENVERFLEVLQPYSDITKLHIENYMGSKFPAWLMNPSVTNLVELSLIRCKRCVELPPLGKLPLLEVLTIDEMDATMYLCNASEESGRFTKFLSLKKLVIKNMYNLLGWSVVEGRSVLPCLEELVVESCPNLIKFPDIPSIKPLKLDYCGFDLLKMATKITSLSSLVISGISELINLPEGLLRNNPHLLSLEITDCPNLRHFCGELESLCDLQSLHISTCCELQSLCGLERLSSLKSLMIDGCNSLDSLPEDGLRGLNSLQYLSISNWENLAALPEEMQHLTGLKILHIWSCPLLENLPEWLGNLTSLREIELWYCENLCYLPESMRQLTALQFLSIWSCPQLGMQCQKQEGTEWHKIQHIPFIKINGPYIQAITACQFESRWKSLSRKLPRKRNSEGMVKHMNDSSFLLLQHRQTILNRVKTVLDCSHLKIDWQLNPS